MPFLSEEIWHLIDERTEDIIVAEWPKANKVEENILSDFDVVSEVVSSIRNFRIQKQIPNKEVISLFVKENEKLCKNMDSIICKLGNIKTIQYTNDKLDGAFSFRVKSNEYFIPLEGNIDIEGEIEKLQKELDYTKGFLKSVNGKLNNERFVNNAPDQVVVNEKKKQADAKQKIEILEKQIALLS